MLKTSKLVIMLALAITLTAALLVSTASLMMKLIATTIRQQLVLENYSMAESKMTMEDFLMVVGPKK